MIAGMQPIDTRRRDSLPGNCRMCLHFRTGASCKACGRRWEREEIRHGKTPPPGLMTGIVGPTV